MNEKGQILLIVLLIMTVALTVGLSLATRTILNVRIVTQEEQSQKAFSAAEAGIEETLRNCSTSSCTPASPPFGGFSQNNTTFSVKVNVSNGYNLLVNAGNQILQDEGTQVWLSAYGSTSGTYNGTISMYWGGSSDTCPGAPALELIIISGSKSSPTLSRFAVDPCSGRRSSNSFTVAQVGSYTLNSKNFSYNFDTPQIVNGLFMRVVPLYQSTVMGIIASSALPVQGFDITSTGTVLGQANPITRRIKVFNSYPQLPAGLFNYTLFSGGSSALSQ